MSPRNSRALALALALTTQSWAAELGAILIHSAQATPERLGAARKEARNAIVLSLDTAGSTSDREAAHRILNAGWELYYWVEIGRNPAMADQHPEWMASLQGHAE